MSRREVATDVLRSAAGHHMAQPTAAVIVAAGQSTRMKGAAKQFLELEGIPVLAHTLRAFQRSRFIDQIVVVARAEDRERVEQLRRQFRITKLTAIVEGGETRAKSVRHGVMAVHKSMRFVAIHDGARCLVTPEMIKQVLRAAYRHNAATAAASVTDTVKVASSRGFIERTIDRNRVFLASTPQAFQIDLYHAALAQAGSKDFTDDNQLMEHIKIPVKLVDVGADNIKITTPDDLGRAEDILARRKRT